MAIKEIPLSGKLIKGSDALLVGQNFIDLINMRYTKTNPRAISGMSKINSMALSAYPKIKSGYHFVKTIPSNQSHLLIQSYNTGETASQILVNNTAVPNTGDFETTALRTDATGASLGRFSDAPLNTVAYCNGIENLIWGGDEAQCAGFIIYDPAISSTVYDYTEVISNTQDDINNIATLANAEAGIDADVILMLHLNNAITDDSLTTPHTVTPVNITYSSSIKVFGSHSAVLNGTTAKLTIPDNVDFDFTGGNFTIDARLRVNSLSSENPFYYQENAGGDYIVAYIDTDGSVKFRINTTAADTVSLSTSISEIVIDTQYHIEIVEDGNAWYLFIDGALRDSVNDTDRALDYDQIVQIGYNADNTTWFDGYIDEYRISDITRHTNTFEIPVTEYTTSTAAVYFYVGSLLPLKGFKTYIKTANTTLGTLTVDYFDGASWVATTNLIDDTSSGGISLAQTGTVSFDDTSNVAKLRMVESRQIYWYKVYITGADSSTTISQCTLDYSIQPIKDIWNGIHRTCLSCQKNAGPFYVDYTTNVYTEDYIASSTSTYADIESLSIGDSLLCGFIERQSGLFLVLGNESDVSCIMNIQYYNGDSWVSVDGLIDETSSGGKCLAKSGTVTWNIPDANNEFKTNITRNLPLYYYRISFTAVLGAATTLDHLVGIPAQEKLGNYSFPLLGQNRLWLCNRTDKNKNTVKCSSAGTFSVFNGADSAEISFGDNKPIIAGTSLYVQYGSEIYDILVFCKEFETWIVIGNSPSTWGKIRALRTIGCVAPLTMLSIHVNPDLTKSLNRHVAVWQASDGIYIFDGRVPTRIHGDIDVFFDPDSTGDDQINPDLKKDSIMFFDETYQEIHWCFASGTSTKLNREFVYSLIKNAWFEIARGTNNNLHGGIPVKDISGNSYIYGFNDTGYCFRLENGTSFNGSSIACTLQTGDFLLEESLILQTGLDTWSLTTVNKNTPITVDLFLDSRIASVNTYTISTNDFYSGRRISSIPKNGTKTPTILYRLKFQTSSTTEAPNFEPLILSFNYKKIKLNKN